MLFRSSAGAVSSPLFPEQANRARRAYIIRGVQGTFERYTKQPSGEPIATVRLSTFPNLPAAHLARETLVAEGIDAELQGIHRPQLGGEIPFPDARVEVWVDEADLEVARGVLAAVERAADGPPRTCAHCGEESPSSFDLCWSCGRVL